MTNYVSYNAPDQVASLDMNTPNGNHAVVFPLNIYQGHPFPLSQYACDSGPRNTQYDYIYDWEKLQHPDYPSRYGYANCWNGYCSGHWPGRYNTPPGAKKCTDEQPPDMAPQRFYTGRFQSPFYPDTPAYTESRVSRYLR